MPRLPEIEQIYILNRVSIWPASVAVELTLAD